MSLSSHDPAIHRRQLLELAARSCLGVSVLTGMEQLADAAPASSGKSKRMIYLFMTGAMSQLDTFDPKPKNKNVQGDTSVIRTKLSGVQFGQYLPKTAALAKQIAVIRSMTTETAAHGPAQYIMRTNYKQLASTVHPGWGSWMHKMLGRDHKELPCSVHIGRGQGPGYLGTKFAPVPIGDPSKGLENTKSPDYVTESQFDKRMSLAGKFDRSFRQKTLKNLEVAGYDELYRDSIGLLRAKDLKAFNIQAESEKVRQAYGDTKFGQGCLLARRLIEHGVRYVEVSHGRWDHHVEIAENLPDVCSALDQGYSTLIKDLGQRGLLDDTLVVLGTEFGRKPKINQNAGRDHHPVAFSTVLAGGGIRGGQVYGATDKEAFHVHDDAVSVADFNATIGKTLGLPLEEEIFSPTGRPFTIANGGTPVSKLIG